MCREDRKHSDKTRGGGVLILIKDELNPVILLDYKNEQFKECAWCKICCNGQDTVIGVCYRAPDSSKQNDEWLFKMFDNVSNGRVIIMGDFNYAELDWSSSEKVDVSHQFVECLGRNFLYQHVEEPTRGQNYLDLLLSTDNIIEEVKVGEPFESSDHQVIRFEVIVPKKVKDSNTVKYNYFKADYDAVRAHAEKLDWDGTNIWTNNNTVSEEEVTQFWNVLKSNVLKLRDKHIGVKKKPLNNVKWGNREVKRGRKAKKKAWDNYVKSGREDALYEIYKKRLNESVAINRKARYDYEQKLADNIKEDCKSFYAYVNSKKCNSRKVGPLEDPHGELVQEPDRAADILNNYFSSVFVDENLSNIPKPIEMFSGTEGLSSVLITESVVLDKLKRINVSKSQGPDQLHGKLLYEIRYQLVKPLTKLFNLSLDTGCIPQDWKDADVVPLHKKGSRSKCENYRPVSLTSILCKLFESVLKEAVTNHLRKNNLINESQHGFTEGKSCLTNLLEFFEFVTKELDESKDVDVIYLDFSKAFDSVPHKRLIHKVKAHGIVDKVSRWIDSWLAGRRQRVCIDGKFSNWVKVGSGVPQGSVLGPILFLIYINDIDLDVFSKINKFADDCKLGKSIKNQGDKEILQNDLQKLSKWANDWQMQFNIDKCSVVHFGKKNPCNDYYLNAKQIKRNNVERDLGVITDKGMKFDEQCNKAASSANMTLGMIRRSITCKNKNVILKLYKALVRPKLEYCVQSWRPYLKKNIEKLEKIQHRATKMIEGYRNYSYEDRLKYTGLTTLEDRRTRGDLIEVYKFMHRFNTVNKDIFFTMSKNKITRGNSYKLEKGRSRLDIRKHYFSQRVVNYWNCLPEDVVGALSVNSFKNKYDSYKQAFKS